NSAQMAILSSLFPRRVHGLDQYERLDYPRVLFHDVFHRLGYDTATITSQDENWQGMRRFQATETPTFFWFSESYEGEHLDSGVEKIVPDEDTTEIALDWLSTSRRAPWALYLNFQATHFPYTLVPDADRPFSPDRPSMSTFGYLGYPQSERQIVVNRYDNALRYVDEQLGRVFHYLDAAGELDDTLIVITADHGEMFFEKGLVTHGKTLFDVEARVPVIVHWRGHVAPQRRKDPVSNLDLMPTIAELVGFPAHPSWQGRSFVTPPPGSRPPAIFMNIQGLRFADAIVCWPYKLILERTSERQHLFDLSRDPAENADLIEDQPEIAARLADTLTKQLLAQLDYHREEDVEARQRRFQPRLRSCPDMTGATR
ncbi:MAG: sulfatase-like hydrolase/transferase, partial [Polyangiaceae bacterium]